MKKSKGFNISGFLDYVEVVQWKYGMRYDPEIIEQVFKKCKVKVPSGIADEAQEARDRRKKKNEQG